MRYLIFLALALTGCQTCNWPTTSDERLGLIIPGRPVPGCPGLTAATPWPRHTIYAGSTGADGVQMALVDDDALLDMVAPWESGTRATVSIHPGLALAKDPWTTVAPLTSFTSAEDAKVGDLDGDGTKDIVGASQSGKTIRVSFGPVPNTEANVANPALWSAPITITAATGISEWMQVDFGDADGDGDLDIFIGGRSAVPAKVGWLENPGGASARTAGAWTWNEIGNAGLTMSLIVMDFDGDGDPDVAVSDRSYVDIDGTVPNRVYTLMGARWLENVGAPGDGSTWTNHTIITDITGDAAPNDDEMKFIAVGDLDGDGDFDVVGGRSDAGPANVLTISRNGGDNVTWIREVIPTPTNIGRYQTWAIADVDRDTAPDLVLTTTADADGATVREGVVWLKGPAYTERGTVSADTELTKYDVLVPYDVDVDGDVDFMVNEQTFGYGNIWFENLLFRRCT